MWTLEYIRFILVLLTASVPCALSQQRGAYYGRMLGRFENTLHDVAGTVYVAGEDTIFIKDFSYDGKGPDAHFWAGNTDIPGPEGTLIPDENGSDGVLPRYNNQDVILKLPAGRTIKDFKHFGVWCRKALADFGHLKISREFQPPRPQTIEGLPTLGHGVKSGPIQVKDAKTIVIPDFHYDGFAPDAFFLVGKGTTITHNDAIKLVKEDGSQDRVLRSYNGEMITYTFPEGTTVRDFDWVAMYCIKFTEDFGHVFFPSDLNVPPVLPRTSRSPTGVSEDMSESSGSKFVGQMLGQFRNTQHGVKGTVYAVNEDTFYIADFSYDGLGPDAYFWTGTSFEPNAQGFIVPNEMGRTDILKGYNNQNLVITLPNGKKIRDVRYIGVWCRKFSADFGHIKIPNNFEPPREKTLGQIPTFAHGVRSGTVTIKDAKTIHIRNLHYDGKGPDAFFLVGRGSQPNGQGTKVSDENGSLRKLHGYNGQSITLRLPGSLTFYDIDWFSLYCIQFSENFGHIAIPKDLNVPPDVQELKAGVTQFENCEEIFNGKMQVLWRVTDQDIIVQLMGEARENEYLSFGLSGSQSRAEMVGGDVVLAFYDKDKQAAQAVDYKLTAKAQCSVDNGVCPDTKLGGRNSIQLIAWQRENGKLSVTYKRSLRAEDDRDMSIQPYDSQVVIAAIGPLNSQKEASFHTTYYTKETLKWTFGRNPAAFNCKDLLIGGGASEGPDPKVIKGWGPFKIKDQDIFRAQIGPTGGDRGYTSITGIQSWGYSWWINGLLVPELVLVRGRNYTFKVEGGSDPNIRASFHPLYITNNPEGGGGQFPKELESPNHKIYAGLRKDRAGNWVPIGAGRLCEWKSKSGVDMTANASTFEEFKNSLRIMCEEGQPAEFSFTPDETTPDTLYYQCYTHRNFGWKITVTDGSSKNCKGSIGLCLFFIAATKTIFRWL